MILNSKEQTPLQSLKWKFLSFQVAFMKHQQQSSCLVFTLTTVIYSFLRSIILWKSWFLVFEGINNTVDNLQGENWSTSLNIDSWVMDVLLIMSINLGVIIFFLGLLSSFGSLMNIIYWIYFLATLSSPIIMSFSVSNIKILLVGQTQQMENIWVKWLYVVEYLLLYCFHLLFIFYEITPLRSKNIFWKLSNRIALFRYLVDFARIILFTFGEISLVPVCISLFVELSIKSFSLSDSPHLFYGYLNPKIRAIDQMPTDTVVIVHLVVLAELVTADKYLGTNLFFILIICMIIKVILEFVYGKNKITRIPACSRQNLIGIYNFYYEFISKNKNDRDIQKILRVHKLQCEEEDCILDSDLSFQEGGLMNEFTRKITTIFKRYKYTEPKYEMIYELWKHELNLRLSINLQSRDFASQNNFIIRYIMGKNNSSTQLLSAQIDENLQKINPEKITFLYKTEEVLTNIETFYLELIKPQPNLSVLTSNLSEFVAANDQTIFLFEKLNRQRKLDFVMVELYSHYIHTFYEGSSYKEKLSKKLKTIRVEKQKIQPNKIDKPVFYVAVHGGKIQQSNAEALKFFGIRKFQLQEKHFTDFYEPKIPLDLLYEKSTTGSNQKFLLFFVKYPIIDPSEKQYKASFINIELKTINNKLFYVIQLERREFNEKRLDFMVEISSKELLAFEKKTLLFSSVDKKSIQKMPFKKLYQESLKGQVSQIQSQQSVYIKFKDSFGTQKNCIILKKEQITENTLNFELRMIEDDDEHKFNSNERKNQSLDENFSFQYCEDLAQNLRLNGSYLIKQQSKRWEKLKNSHTKSQQKKVEELLLTLCARKATDFQKGIKTYRLFHQELYNIDLQDKQAYQRQFDEVQKINSKEHYSEKVSPNVLVWCSIMLISLIIGLTIAILFLADSSVAQFTKENNRIGNINLFILEYNVMNGLLRDVANGQLTRLEINYKQLVDSSYQKLQRYTTLSLFDENKLYTVRFKDRDFTGTLNELIQFTLVMIHQTMRDNDFEKIEDLHDLQIYYFADSFNEQEDQMKSQLQEAVKNLKFLADIQTFIIFGFTFLLSFLIIGINFAYKIRLARVLKPFLLLSQIEAKQLVEEAQNLKQCVFSAIKNSNSQSAISQKNPKRENFKKRNKPKTVDSRLSTRLSELLFVIIISGLLLVITMFYQQTLTTEVNKVQKMIVQRQALIKSYSMILKASFTIEHAIQNKQQIQTTNLLDETEKCIKMIENSKQGLEFSEQLSADIQTVFFNDSCAYMSKKGFLPQNENCSNSQPQFKVYNPFELGMIYYFINQYFNLKNDLSQTFAIGGVHAQSFKRIFTDFGNRTTSEITSFGQEINQKIQLLNYLILIVCIIEIVIVFGIQIYFKSKQKMIKDVIMKFTVHKEQIEHKSMKNLHFVPQKQEELSEMNIQRSEQNSQIESEDEIVM